MKLYLNRTCTRGLTTDGVLQNQRHNRICDTAEHTLHMLPEGTYQLTLELHKKLDHRAPCIQQGNATAAETTATAAATAASWIIHGNGVHGKDFGSSIAIGDCLVPGVVIRSHPCFERLVKRLDKAIKRGSKVKLIITSS